MDGLHTKPDENVVATSGLGCELKGICTPGLAGCESCEYKPTKTALSVLEATRYGS